SNLPFGWGIDTPADILRNPASLRKTTMSQELLLGARLMGDVKIRFETLEIKTTKSKVGGKELRDVVIRALCEAFMQDPPDSDKLAQDVKTARKKKLTATASARKKYAAAQAKAK